MSGEASTWMPLYIGDYLGDTQRLTTEQHGAYILLIIDYWRNGPPPDDDSILQQIVRLDKSAWKKHRLVLSKMFQIIDGEWKHKRIDKELIAAKDNAERRSKKAKAGADARWGKRQTDASSNAPSMPQALPEECAPPSPSPREANASPRARDVSDLMKSLCQIAKIEIPDPGRNFAKHQSELLTVESWIEAGADPALIQETLTKRCAALRTSPRSLAFFDKPVRQAVDDRNTANSTISEHTDALIVSILGRNAA